MLKSCGGLEDYRDSPESKFLFPFWLGLGTWTRACQLLLKYESENLPEVTGGSPDGVHLIKYASLVLG